jgi:probable rRNA maturation factor
MAGPLIQFNYLVEPFYFPERNKTKSFIINLIKKEGGSVDQINYIFCSDAFLLQINQRYLKHDTYTDILTFPFSAPSEPILADIYISIDRVRENAKSYHTAFKKELHRVIFHGALHLCGYKDKTSEQARQMRAREEFYLKSFFVPRGTKKL